ncbi:MAG: hypothetical protein ACFE0Q_16900 [Anaerolineae bacterium]
MSANAPKRAFFLTWHLWSAVRYPRRQHPIFRYGFRQRFAGTRSGGDWRGVQIGIGLFVGLFAVIFPVQALVIGLGVAISLPVLMLIGNGTVLGLIWMLAISQAIATAQAKQQFDLMQLSPAGALGVAWMLATGIVHRDGWHRQSYRVVLRVLRAVLILLGIACVVMLMLIASTPSAGLRAEQARFIGDILQLCLLALALWLDHVQSILIALLLGILAPTFLKDALPRRTLLVLIFVVTQILTYLLVLVIYQLARVIALSLLGMLWFTPLLLMIIGVFSLFALRETIMSILWQVMVIRYDDVTLTYYLNVRNA